MANQEHVNRLKQGVDAWNRWRAEHPDVRPRLSAADFGGVDLSGVNLRLGDLLLADLSRARLVGANLVGANLNSADLSGANLRAANLSYASLNRTDLGRANLNQANLGRADLEYVNLHEAALTMANLYGAHLFEADLSGADFGGATVGYTTFANLDLSVAKGLDTVVHKGPSTIGINAIYHSHGKIPAAFLRGAGVPDTFIAAIASLAGEASSYHSCFISYSSDDEAFAQRLHADLQQQGVRCWLAPHAGQPGDETRPPMDQPTRTYDRLLLVLSEHSIAGGWVEKEVGSAFEEESRRKKTVLFPIRLDATVMERDQAWAADIRRIRPIGDFSRWKDHDSYQRAFDRLLRDLKASGE